MAKAAIVSSLQEKVILELTVEEAAVVYTVLGTVAETGPFRDINSGVRDTLHTIPRVKTWGMEIVRYVCKHGYRSLAIGHLSIPPEPNGSPQDCNS